MGQIFRSFVAFVVGLFAVLEKTAKTLENLSDVAVATSAMYKDGAEEDRVLAREEAALARQKRAAAIARAKAAAAAKANNP